jgi:hypothetical protein
MRGRSSRRFRLEKSAVYLVSWDGDETGERTDSSQHEGDEVGCAVWEHENDVRDCCHAEDGHEGVSCCGRGGVGVEFDPWRRAIGSIVECEVHAGLIGEN